MMTSDGKSLSRRGVLAMASSAAVVAATPLRAQPAPINVVATTGMIADAARAVGGGAVQVQALMGPGIDPHSYRQTRSDIVALTRADLVLWNGLYLEAQMQDFLQKLAERTPVVAVGEAVPHDRLIAHQDYDGKFDPHVWMVPDLWAHVVRAVQGALTRVAPDHADTFATNARAHLAEIDRLGT